MAITRIGNPALADVREPNFRNILINGGMDLAQRGTSSTGLTSGGYKTVDRFNFGISSAGTWTITQDSTVPTGQGFAKSTKLDCTTANGSLGASAELNFYQKIEGQNLQYLKKGTSNAESVTLSFWVRSNKTGTYTAEIFDNDNSRQISKTYTISSADTWEKKTITFPGDTTGALDNDNAVSFWIFFWLGAGSNLTSGTLNTSWNSSTSANRVSSSQVNLADSTSNEWYVTGIQLEAGSVASDFEFLPVDVNENRCLRYYERLVYNEEMYWIGTGFAESNTDVRIVLLYHPKRGDPSASFSGQIRVDPGNRTATSMSFDTMKTISGLFYGSFSASGSTNDAYSMRFNTSGSEIELNSEL
tara:strand:+ start:457 stop:1533 length:1077 start_codon:yes stop_codon:yes gene_type:complete